MAGQSKKMGKPPVLTTKQIGKMVKNKKGFDNCLGCEHGVAEAQRDADLKWFVEWLFEAIEELQKVEG